MLSLHSGSVEQHRPRVHVCTRSVLLLLPLLELLAPSPPLLLLLLLELLLLLLLPLLLKLPLELPAVPVLGRGSRFVLAVSDPSASRRCAGPVDSCGRFCTIRKTKRTNRKDRKDRKVGNTLGCQRGWGTPRADAPGRNAPAEDCYTCDRIR